MERRKFTAAVVATGLLPGLAQAQGAETDAAAGVRAALERGALAAMSLLGRTDGFLGNARVRIPLPGFLEDASRLATRLGQRKRVDELHVAINRAAEAAVPQARDLLVQTVRDLSVEDALRLVRGSGPTAITDFFAAKTRGPLGEKFLPIVTRATEKVGLAQRYNQLVASAAGLGLVRGGDATIEQYVTGKTLDGLFLTIGDEEQKIRANPLQSGSALLRRVFGS